MSELGAFCWAFSVAKSNSTGGFVRRSIPGQSDASTVSKPSTWIPLQTGPLEAENVDTTFNKLAWKHPIVDGRDKVTKRQEELVQGGALRRKLHGSRQAELYRQ